MALNSLIENYENFWAQIVDMVDEGWFVPSRAELSAFGYNLGITYENKDTLIGASPIWSSSQKDSDHAWNLSYYIGSGTPDCRCDVRLSTTF